MRSYIKTTHMLKGHCANHPPLEVTILVEEYSSLLGSHVQNWVLKVTYTFDLPGPA